MSLAYIGCTGEDRNAPVHILIASLLTRSRILSAVGVPDAYGSHSRLSPMSAQHLLVLSILAGTLYRWIPTTCGEITSEYRVFKVHLCSTAYVWYPWKSHV